MQRPWLLLSAIREVLAGDRMEVRGITLAISTRKVFAGRKEIVLTPKEYALLRCLMQNKNMVMSREQLLVKCWGYDYEGEAVRWILISSGYGKNSVNIPTVSRPLSRPDIDWRDDDEKENAHSIHDGDHMAFDPLHHGQLAGFHGYTYRCDRTGNL